MCVYVFSDFLGDRKTEAYSKEEITLLEQALLVRDNREHGLPMGGSVLDTFKNSRSILLVSIIQDIPE